VRRQKVGNPTWTGTPERRSSPDSTVLPERRELRRPQWLDRFSPSSETQLGRTRLVG